MKTSTCAGDYLDRMRRSRRGGNPLVRRADRIEAWLFFVLLTTLALMIPVAGFIGAGSWQSWVALAEKQSTERTPVSATLESAPDPAAPGGGEVASSVTAPAPATWQWGDEQRRAVVPVDSWSVTGGDVTVWVDARSGELADPPLTVGAAKVSAVCAGVFLWALSVALAITMFESARWGLERTRRRRWNREIEAFLGSTSSY